MLCSSRTGLDGVLSCNAATGTAIVFVFVFALKDLFFIYLKKANGCCRYLYIYVGPSGEMIPDQLLTHWSLHRVCAVTTTEKKKKKKKQMTPADRLQHLPEVSPTPA